MSDDLTPLQTLTITLCIGLLVGSLITYQYIYHKEIKTTDAAVAHVESMMNDIVEGNPLMGYTSGNVNLREFVQLYQSHKLQARMLLKGEIEKICGIQEHNATLTSQESWDLV